jgi:sterol desaturase/sphingolipid hydroxylase (fatty acid hydroxylase superfamily)
MVADIRQSAMGHAVGDVLQDVSELVQKELRFARAELSAKLYGVVRKVAWIAVAGLFAVMTLLVLVEAAILALADAGWALHWSCLMVGGALAVVALMAYLVGRAASNGTLPARTLQHLTRDIRTAKEHLA